jgi:anti-sigma factor RsiW
MSSDPFAHHDAAYVLGALGPADRRAFEEHLAGCDACTRAVADLAGLPALLSQVDEPVYAGPETSPPLPETLLPRLLEAVRRRRRRMRVLTAVGAAAAVVVVAVVSAVLLLGGSPSEPAPAQAMTQVHQDRLTAAVSLEDVAWGTRMRLTCTYRGDGWGEAPPSYALVVRTRDGATEQVATWRGVPDKETRLQAATSAAPADIASVEIVVAGTDRALLRLRPTRA